jgi:acyl-CoA thioesterase-1
MAVVRRLFLLAAVLLAACGTHKPEQNQAPEKREPPPVAPAPDDRGVLVALGDSLTAGFGAEPGKSFPDFLQQEIDGKGYKWRVVNLGVSGDTSTDGLSRMSEAIALQPRIVILELGANDGLRGIPIERMRENLDQMITAFQHAGARVVLAGMTLPPNYGPEYISGFETTYRDLAKKYKLKIIPFLLEGVGGHADLMQRDGLHPTAEGNRRVAANVMRVLEPLLEVRKVGGKQ